MVKTRENYAESHDPSLPPPAVLLSCCGVSTPLMPQEMVRDLGQGGAEQKFFTRDLTDVWKFEGRRVMCISVVVRSNEFDPTVQLVRRRRGRRRALPQDGVYTIGVGACGAGSYQLRVIAN
jgi:hypothetical protein